MILKNLINLTWLVSNINELRFLKDISNLINNEEWCAIYWTYILSILLTQPSQIDFQQHEIDFQQHEIDFQQHEIDFQPPQMRYNSDQEDINTP